MSKVRLGILAVLVALVVTSVAAASASAHEWKVGGAKIASDLKIKALSAETKELLAPKTAGQFPTITCGMAVSTGAQLLAASPFNKAEATKITFTECVDGSEPTHCEVRSGKTAGTIETSVLTGVITTNRTVEFKPTAGTVVMSFKITSKPPETCGGALNMEVKGQATCEDGAATTEAVTHTCNFTATSGSKLTVLGGKEAVFARNFSLEAEDKATKWSFN